MKQLDGKPPRSVYPAVQADIPFANEYRAWVKDLLGEERTATYFLPGALEPLAHTATSPHGAKGRCDPESKCVCVVCYQSLDEHARFALEATNKLPRVSHFARGELAASPSSRARSRWQSVKQYQLRTSDSTNLPLSPATSSGNLRAAAS